MNFGGIIAGALGGGAQAVGQITDREMQNRDAEAASLRMEQRQIEGEKRRSLLNREEAAYAAAEKLKGEMASRRQYAQDMDSVDARAKQIGTDRDVKALQIPDSQAGPQVTPEVVDTFSKSQREGYEKQGLLEKRGGSGMIMDKINAARELGADPLLRKNLSDDYKLELMDENKKAQADFQERRLAETERSNAAKEDLRAKQIASAIRSSGGGNTDFDKKMAVLKAGGFNERQLANFVADKKQPSVTELAAKFLNEDPFKMVESKRMTPEKAIESAKALIALSSKMDGESATPSPVDKPKSTPAQSKPDANVALSDARRAIQKNPANRDEVVRRLKAAGIDTKGL